MGWSAEKENFMLTSTEDCSVSIIMICLQYIHSKTMLKGWKIWIADWVQDIVGIIKHKTCVLKGGN